MKQWKYIQVYIFLILGIVQKMYMMNLEEDDSIDDKMNTTNDGNENNSKGDNEKIDFTYRGVSRYLVCRRIDFRWCF